MHLSKDITTLFVGSMILAYAMEYVHLHRRLALRVLCIIGSSAKWLYSKLFRVEKKYLYFCIGVWLV